MDTKLKKFDSSIIAKGIALILALVLAGAGTMGVLLFFEENETDELYDYYRDFLSQGSNFEIEKSYVFYNKYSDFLDLLTEKTIIYQNGDKQSYEAFQKKVKKEYNDEVKHAMKEMLDDIVYDENYPENLIEYAESNELRLVKIGDLSENDYVSFSDIEDEDVEVTTSMPNVTVPSTVPQQSVQSASDDNKKGSEKGELNYFAGVKNGIYYSDNVPEEYLKKADKAQAVVALSDVSYGGTILNGYYKVYLNSKNIIPDPDEDFGCVEPAYNFSSFEEFSNYAKITKESLSKYKNMSYAIIDNKSGKVVETTLNGTDKLNTANEVKNAFLDCELSYVYNISKEDLQYGSLFSELLKDREANYYFHIDYIDTRIYDLAKDGDYTLCVSFDTNLSEDDVFSEIVNTYNSLYKKAKSCFLLSLLYLLGIVICIVVLVIKSGRRHGDNELHMAYCDRMIFVLRTAIDGGIITLIVAGVATVYDNINGTLMRMLMCLCFAGIALFLIDWILYISRNIKNRSLHKTFVTILLFQKAKQLFKKVNAAMKSRTAQYRDIFNDVARKIVLGVLVPNFAAAVILLLLVAGDGFAGLELLLTVLILLYDIFVVFYMIRYAYNLRKIFYTLNQLSRGNYDVHIDTNGMPISVAAYANDVNAINNGLQIAVNNAVKEEKTKTELITNISHDLKTPLTSIINYVDLLSRCEITDENALGYIEILNEKSAKLKRLIEDLVEASKAQTGNINVNIIKMSLNELVLQLAGEYEDEFAAKNLTLIIDGAENIIEVMADSKLAYRVLDNLLNNVKKYAMPNTRVYISIERSGEKGLITLRNISENQLNIPAKELMARFVRGDSSRSTDGNGLGLSIAENLCLIQGGKLTLEIEGDLFTAKVEYKGA